ncbi:hypothetical protein [Endozoicomonas arenosclerae]|uniref:hypothetical protein n=1 Tax=Endozoicomonas arenosclerae TaxID=1633495 RepID=UPI000780DC29|nr:hypothetical protein [Endozoicomonas arenosclerae]
MQGSGRISAGIQTALYAAATPVRGLATGLAGLGSAALTPGAGVGFLAGKLVGKVVGAICNRLNKGREDNPRVDTEKHVRRTAKVLETAGAIIGAPLVAAKIAANPIFSTLSAIQFSVNTVTNTLSNLAACKTVYQELRKYGTSETAKENLFDPVDNILLDIYHGTDIWHTCADLISDISALDIPDSATPEEVNKQISGLAEKHMKKPHLEALKARHNKNREDLEHKRLDQLEAARQERKQTLMNAFTPVDQDEDESLETVIPSPFTPSVVTPKTVTV